MVRGCQPGCGPSRRGSGRASRARGSFAALPGGRDAGAVVLADLLAEPGSGRRGCGRRLAGARTRPVLEGERAVAERGGLLAGAGDVAAAGDAPVEAGRVPPPVAVAQGPVPLVMTQDERMRVAVNHCVLVL